VEEDYRSKPAHRFAREIADAMGPQWTYDAEDVTNSRCAHLDGPNAGRIRIILDPWYDDPEMTRRDYRIEVIGCYARFLRDDVRPHEHEAPRITCAPSRGAETIASDIERRFLPDYWPALDETHNAAGRYERQFYKMLDGMGVLSETLEARFEPEPTAWGTPNIRWSGRDMSTRIQWHGEYGISMEINHLPVDVAVEIAELLKQHEDAQVPAHMKER
jgi:hypothetical protein